MIRKPHVGRDKLDSLQLAVVDLVVKARKNVFITGAGGTGKSVVLCVIQDELRKQGIPFAVTGSTGHSATHVNGQTLHSWLGCGLGDGGTQNVISRVHKQADVCKRLQDCQILIIDEISMVSADFLDLVDAIPRDVRDSLAPFGGLCVVPCGDCAQMPPVDNTHHKYCFQSNVWPLGIHCVVQLEHNYRQTEDGEFLAQLNKMRLGMQEDGDHRFWEGLVERKGKKRRIAELEVALPSPVLLGEGSTALAPSVPVVPLVPVVAVHHEIEPTRLFPHNRDVDAENERQLKATCDPTTIQTFEREEKITPPRCPQHTRRLLQQWLDKKAKDSMSKQTVQLAIGAQVMLTANLDVEGQRANGSRGVVVRFSTGGWPVVKFTDGKDTEIRKHPWTFESEPFKAACPRACYKQVPLRLAWSLSTHKVQGMTLDAVECKINRDVFEEGMAYTMLSRTRNRKSLRLLAYDRNMVRTNPDVKQFYAKLTHNLPLAPVVSALTPGIGALGASVVAGGTIGTISSTGNPAAMSASGPVLVPGPGNMPSLPTATCDKDTGQVAAPSSGGAEQQASRLVEAFLQQANERQRQNSILRYLEPRNRPTD